MRLPTLNILRCPICGGTLTLDAQKVEEGDVVEGKLSCVSCGRAYAVSGGIPDFVVEQCLRGENRLQRLFYNLYAPLYDGLERRLAELLGFSEEELRSEVVSRMEIGRGDSVLEVCVGTGGNIPYFRRYTDGLVAGLDISEGMLSVCRSRARREGWGDVELFLGCAEFLPFKDEAFDRVLIGGAISHFSDPGRALAEAARVTKKEGKVVVYEQVTLLEKVMGRDRPSLDLLPPSLTLLGVTYLLGGRFYVVELLRR